MTIGADITTAGHVQIDNVSVSFLKSDGELASALLPTSLDLPPGSFTALIGPSGSGKSTLLNAIAGFIAPSSGQIKLDGRAYTEPSSDIGVVFQQYALFPWFTARGNIEFALGRLSLNRHQTREKALAILNEIGLKNHAETYPEQLSGGMKQRVAIGRTLACEPKVLLLDEPFGALDAQTRLGMHAFLEKILDAHPLTTLLVTHDVDEAINLADSVCVMSHSPGRIVKKYNVSDYTDYGFNSPDATIKQLRAEILEHLKLDLESQT
ncbi:MAG: ABC transporter ATP-binding protein [Synergistaceae bacterium]|nr:ABC transporter ATP-binding protein [Synergistaceae bacterium]